MDVSDNADVAHVDGGRYMRAQIVVICTLKQHGSMVRKREKKRSIWSPRSSMS